MTQTGVLAPRVVVQPPATPAPPPISLLTQGTTVEPGGEERWAGGGGVTWMEPLRGTTDLWQAWPTSPATADSAKDTSDRVSADQQAPNQIPIVAVTGITEGALQAFADGQAGDTEEAQLQRAMAAAMPRAVEAELWGGAKATAADWPDQFRFTNTAIRDTSQAGAGLGFLHALAEAEQLAADHKFVDDFGGVMLHVSWGLFSLIMATHQSAVVSPTGRQVRLPSGAVLVPELGATSASQVVATPPVRVRLGRVDSFLSQYDLSNDRAFVVEQPFIIEAPVIDSRPTVVIVGADLTKEF